MRYGESVPIAGQWSGGLSNNRETITLVAFDGETIHQFEYRDEAGWPLRSDGTGSSLVVVNLEGDYTKPENWKPSAEINGTPGAPEDASTVVVINEVLTHTDLPQVDSIELFNVGTQQVNIGGWYLSDNTDDYLKFEIPANTVLQPGDYIVFDENDFNAGMPGVTDFALNGATGDEVWLVQTDGNGNVTKFVDDVEFPAAANGESFGRLPNGTGPLAPMLEVTLGNANSAARVGPALITEVNYAPGEPTQTALNIFADLSVADLEFVEITNTGSTPIELSNWRLRGGIDFDFPAGTFEPGGKRLIVSFDPSDPSELVKRAAFLVQYGIGQDVALLGPFSGRLNNAGERVTLQRPDEPPIEDPTLIPRLVEDEVIYDDVAPWPESADGAGDSLQRVGIDSYGNAASNWIAADPTPGEFDFGILGDFDDNRTVDDSDIDLLFAAVQAGNHPPRYDLTGDSLVNNSDVDTLLTNILNTVRGDTDLDGDIDSADATALTVGWTGALGVGIGDRGWADGDTDGDGDVDTADRTTLAINWTGAIDAAIARFSSSQRSSRLRDGFILP